MFWYDDGDDDLQGGDGDDDVDDAGHDNGDDAGYDDGDDDGDDDGYDAVLFKLTRSKYPFYSFRGHLPPFVNLPHVVICFFEPHKCLFTWNTLLQCVRKMWDKGKPFFA